MLVRAADLRPGDVLDRGEHVHQVSTTDKVTTISYEDLDLVGHQLFTPQDRRYDVIKRDQVEPPAELISRIRAMNDRARANHSYDVI